MGKYLHLVAGCKKIKSTLQVHYFPLKRPKLLEMEWIYSGYIFLHEVLNLTWDTLSKASFSLVKPVLVVCLTIKYSSSPIQGTLLSTVKFFLSLRTFNATNQPEQVGKGTRKTDKNLW